MRQCCRTRRIATVVGLAGLCIALLAAWNYRTSLADDISVSQPQEPSRPEGTEQSSSTFPPALVNQVHEEEPATGTEAVPTDDAKPQFLGATAKKNQIVTTTDQPNIFTDHAEFEFITNATPTEWLGKATHYNAAGTIRGMPRVRLSEQRELSRATVENTNAEVIDAFHNEHWNPSWKEYFNYKTASAARQPLNATEAEKQENIGLMDRMKVPVKSYEDLELIDNHSTVVYVRPKGKRVWRENQVRIACLFAGFVRDYDTMFTSCNDIPRPSKYCIRYEKFYGNMRDNLFRSTQCDVYISTWDIRGAGRYDTTTYAMNHVFNSNKFHSLFGDNLAAFHLQRYEPYQKLWNYTNKFTRPFPQSRPRVLYVDPVHRNSYFSSSPEMNYLLRPNDYSQSYKHWCVVNLVRLVGEPYDLYFRLRFDLRSTAKIHSFRFATLKKTGERAITFQLTPYLQEERSDQTHYVTEKRLHAQNFDIGDFGFLGTPNQIEMLSRLWYYCTAPPGTQLTPGKWVPFVYQRTMFSEYNYMMWRVVFDQKWEIDNGGRYLWVSRFGSRSPKKSKR